MTSSHQKITLRSKVLQWARERAGYEPGDIASKVNVKEETVLEWEKSGVISMAQVEKLARHTYTPHGYLYLSEPPEDKLLIPDFRASRTRKKDNPSPDLLETVRKMKMRQTWMREELIADGVEPLDFVGKFNGKEETEIAEAIRKALGFEKEWAATKSSWENALRFLRRNIEKIGILAIVNGIVGNNTSRKLDPEEFQGFALADEYAPLIFINGADYKSAQMFTFAHELAHIFIGKEGVSGLRKQIPEREIETTCNSVAAEFLLPSDSFISYWKEISKIDNPYESVAQHFKVSQIVVARKALDLKLVSRDDFFLFYNQYLDSEYSKSKKKSQGGNFWSNQNVRIGEHFGIAITRAVKEGRLLYYEAYKLTDLKGESFNKFVRRMETLL